MNAEDVIAQTRRWIADVVIGLNLCPFARRVFDGELIRYRVSMATDRTSLEADLRDELRTMNNTPATEIETAFLIHPFVLTDFLDFNDFVADAENLIEDMELSGVFQIASFHPQYQFAGTRPDDVENYTNRSPFPMLHLLREDSITKVNDDPEKLADIPQRNIAMLRSLGRARMLALLRGEPLSET